MSWNSTKKSMMMRMNRWFKVTCRDTSPLISELMDHTLPLGKRLRLRFHLMICGVCSIYKQQLEIIRALSQKMSEDDAPTQKEAALSEQAKTKI